MLEVISNKPHLEKYPNWRQWDTESRRAGSALLAGITKHLSFLIDWTTVVRSLFYLRGSTKKIQGRSLDLLDLFFRFHSKPPRQRVFFTLLWVRIGNGLPNRFPNEDATNCCLPIAPRKCRVWHTFQLL